MNMQEMKPFLGNLAKGITELYGSNCEVAVHDLTGGYENTIIIIENGHVSKRAVGDGSSEKVLKALKKKGKGVEDDYCYLARTKEGRILKSSSVYLRDENGEVIGLFGINYDITDLMMMQSTVKALIGPGDAVEDTGKIEALTTNITDLLEQLIQESNDFVGKPVAMMTKDDKTRAIQYLNERGAFLIKKAGDKISKYYDISKYTLYKYMDADSEQSDE